jgi:hypothetical protein
MLAWLYSGAPAVAVEWRLLHASLQIFGFFGTLIVGVAAGVAIAWAGGESHLLTDAVRHLVAVGFLTAVAIAMTWLSRVSSSGQRFFAWERICSELS